MSTIDMKPALSAATLLNAVQLPVVIADLVLGITTKEELLERSTIKRRTSKAEQDFDAPSELATTAGELSERRDAMGSHQLSANQITREVTTKLKFK